MQIADNVLQVALGCYTHSTIYPAPKGSDPSPFQVRPPRPRSAHAAAACGGGQRGGTRGWHAGVGRPAPRQAAPHSAARRAAGHRRRVAAQRALLSCRRWLRPVAPQMAAVLLTGNGVAWLLFCSLWGSVPFRQGRCAWRPLVGCAVAAAAAAVATAALLCASM